jgi:hypothetical protein
MVPTATHVRLRYRRGTPRRGAGGGTTWGGGVTLNANRTLVPWAQSRHTESTDIKAEETADSRQQTADSRQQTADSRQQTADSRHQTADSRQQTAASRQQTADSRQQTDGVSPYLGGHPDPHQPSPSSPLPPPLSPPLPLPPPLLLPPPLSLPHPPLSLPLTRSHPPCMYVSVYVSM